MMNPITTWTERAFTIDLRTLALFRIAFGLVLTAHLFQIAPNLTAFFADSGAFPRETAKATHSGTSLSLYMLSGSTTWVWTLWSVTFASCLCFVAGYRTKIATVALLILFLSLNSRNPLIFQAGDRLVILLLFWSTMLPLGSRWSLDARKRPTNTTQATAVYSIASAGILLQMACLYFFTGIEKSAGPSWHEHNSVMFALQALFSNTTRDMVLDYPKILYILNDAVLVFELAIPMFLFLPIFQPLVRIVTLAGLVIMHLSFAHFLNIGLFSFDAMAGLCLFLPAQLWGRVSNANKTARYHLTPPHVKAMSLALLGLMLYGNMATVHWLPNPQWYQRPLDPIKLSQEWKMFAPNVGSRVNWTFMRGHTNDGTIVDPFNKREIDLAQSYPTDWREVAGGNLWLKFHTRIYNSKRQQAYLSYWCRDWNQHFPEKPLQKIELFQRQHYLAYPPIVKDASNTKEWHLMTVTCD